MDEKLPRWSEQTKIIVSLLLLALFIYLLFRFRIILTPLILALILAYVLSPLANLFQNRLHLRRLFATALTYFVFLLLLVSLVMGIIPLVGAQFRGLNLDIQLIVQRLQALLAHQYNIFGWVIDGEAIFKQLTLSFQGLLEPIFGRTVNLAVDIISSIAKVIVIIVVSFYLVKDGSALRDWLERSVPPNYRPVYIRLRDEINRVWSAFFRGQLILAFVVSIIFTIIGFILGLPFALAMGLFAGLLEFFPSIGHGIWMVSAALLALFVGSTWLPIQNWVFMLIVVALHLFYQQFDLNYLIPRIIGRSVHLPPLVVILGIVSGAVLAGVLGIALAAPSIASARVLGRYIYANLFDLVPSPETVVPPLPPPDARWWRSKRKKERFTH
jgi:predicted PurR-regulated permease PerM